MDMLKERVVKRGKRVKRGNRVKRGKLKIRKHRLFYHPGENRLHFHPHEGNQNKTQRQHFRLLN